jgi:hypothetical protein
MGVVKMLFNEKALLTALKNLVGAVKHLDVCPSTLQGAEEIIANIEKSPYKSTPTTQYRTRAESEELVKNQQPRSMHLYQNAKLAPIMLIALEQCAVKFDEYAKHHQTNGAEEKAARNQNMAEMCKTAIQIAGGSGEFEKANEARGNCLTATAYAGVLSGAETIAALKAVLSAGQCAAAIRNGD